MRYRNYLVRPNDRALRDIHKLFGATFGKDEVDPLHVYQTSLATTSDSTPYRSFVIARKQGSRVIAGASGAYIDVFGRHLTPTGEGIGWLEYVAVEEGYRLASHGTKIARRLEKEIKFVAQRKGREFLGFVIHSEDRNLWEQARHDSVGFWEKIGYRRIQMPFISPCYDFDEKGNPLYSSNPYALMFKMGGRKSHIDKVTLTNILLTLKRIWYNPREDFDFQDEESYKRASKHVDNVFNRMVKEVEIGPERIDFLPPRIHD